MTSAEHPITRSELREELRHHATKKDLNHYRSELRDEFTLYRSELRDELTLYRAELREEFTLYRAELRQELGHYATKEDLANLEIRLTREIIGLKSEFADFKGELKSDVADLRAEVKGEISTLIKWMVGVQIGGVAAIAAITTAVIAIAKVIGV